MAASNAEHCVGCGRFMDCADPDAHCVFTPDSDRSIESTEWTCGLCHRRLAAASEQSATTEGAG